jgi:hypothetical protein
MNWVAMGRRKELAAGVFLLAMTLSNLVTGFKLAPQLRNGYQNFTSFYAAGRMIRNGQSASLYDLPAQYQVQRQFAPKVDIRQGALAYNHPPFVALLFVPFTFLGYLPAYLVWTALNLVMVAATVGVLRKQFAEIGILSPAFLGVAAAGFSPVASAIIQGEDSILLLLLFTLALAALENGRDAAAGAVLGAGLLRFHLVLPLVLVLAVRRWRLLLGFAPVAALLTGVSVAMIGWQGIIRYVWFLLRLERSGAGGAVAATDMPNLRGVIAALPGVNAGSTFTMLLTLAGSVALVLVTLWLVKTGDHSLRFAFALATVTAILVSYHTLTYDLSLLLPAVLLLFSAPGKGTRREAQADTVLLVLLYLIPLSESCWPRVNQLGWFVVVLVWLFWKFGRDSSAESGAAS